MVRNLLFGIGNFFYATLYLFLFFFFCLFVLICSFFGYLRHLLISKTAVVNIIKSYKQERYGHYYDDCINLTARATDGKLIKFDITENSPYQKVFLYLRDNDLSFDKKYKIRYFYLNGAPCLMSCRSI